MSPRRSRVFGRSKPQPGQSISERARGKSRPGLIFLLFGIFFAFGALFLALFFGPAALGIVAAGSWTEVECQITDASVKSNSSSDGTTYSIVVGFHYTVDGRTYSGDRYKFLGGSSSGYDGKAQVVERLRIEPTTCWFDPEDPSQSVIERGWTSDFFFALIPLVFCLIGLGGMVFGAMMWRASRRLGIDDLGDLAAARAPRVGQTHRSLRSPDALSSRLPAGAKPAAGRVELEASISPLGKLIGIIFMSLFWNGIVSVFVWQFYKEWRDSGSLDGCMTLFLIPFVLIGLALVAAVPYQLLTLANPRPKLVLDPAPLAVGAQATLDWSLSGSSHRIRRLEIFLKGIENARYRRGTSTHTASEEFAHLVVVMIEDRRSMAGGRALIEVPIDTMHSFDGGSNQIKWSIEVRGDIGWWPDVLCSFPVDIQPPRIGDLR